MEKIQNLTHPKDAFFYAFSRFLERGSYYGMRALIVLYMVGETLKMDRPEALSVYAIFTSSLALSYVLGGVLGDLFVGSRRSVIIGGAFQALGAFVLAAPGLWTLYIGLALIVLGGGFYNSNLISLFGKTYLDRTKLLDSGFTLFYFAMNLGSFLGVLVIGFSGETFGYSAAFILVGILNLISIIPVVLSEKNLTYQFDKHKIPQKKRIKNILIALLAVGLFWKIYELGYFRTSHLYHHFADIWAEDIPGHFWNSINMYFILPLSLIGYAFWNIYYTNQFFKLMFGFLVAAIAFGVLFLIPEVPAQQHTVIFIAAMLILAVAEILLAPVVYSVLTEYSNPKYLATLSSLVFLPKNLFILALSPLIPVFDENYKVELGFSIGALLLLALALFAYILYNKKNFIPENDEISKIKKK